MNGKLVTVFGGSGFIGRYAVQQLAQAGYRLRVAARHPNDALFLKPLGALGEIEIIQANIRDRASVERAVSGADGVVNLVGILQATGKQGFIAIHAEGAGMIAGCAAAAGVRKLVHLSAIGADPASASSYARSKAAGEALVREAFPTATILRPSVVFGPEDRFLNRFAAMARISPALPLIGGGRTQFQPVYVGDVAQAIAAALDHGIAGVYELGGPRRYSFQEILGYILKETGRKRWLAPLPFPIAKAKAALLEALCALPFFPPSPLTVDQVRLLERDNVANPDTPGLAALGIEPTPMEAVAPGYLVRYRPHGRFS